jgi:glycosyltransferase involved in cell wall biosynthesis
MKIILATESFLPNVSGVAIATENLANNLTKEGHEVFVFCPSRSYKSQVDKNFKDYAVLRLKSIVNPFRKGFRITFASEKEIEEKVRAISPDLIHLQDPATIGRGLRNIGKKLGIPVVITNHFSLEYALSYVRFLGPMIPIAKSTLINYLVSFYNKCDYVVTPTETFAKQVRSWGVKVPVQAVSNGIFFDRFQKKFTQEDLNNFRVKYHLPDNPTVLYLGRVDKDKSIDVLVKAAAEVIKKANVHFVIAGSGDEIENIIQSTEDLGIRNYFTFLGRLDHESDDFLQIYKSSSLFAIPSTIETQSLVTLEAMSSGLPVVAADANALPELVKPKINGYLFRPGNHRELSNYILKIIKDKDLAKKMGRSSVNIAANHEMPKAFGHMIELYKTALAKGDKKP